MSRPLASSLRAVEAMSSCNVVPVTIEMSPIKAGCSARQKSCNVTELFPGCYKRTARVKCLGRNLLWPIGRSRLLLPVVRIGLTPLLHSLGVFAAAEVIPIGPLAQPAALTGALTGGAAGGFGTVKLVMPVSIISKKKLLA